MQHTRALVIAIAMGLIACDRSEDRVTSQVKERIAAEPHTAAVDISVDDGIVRLRGYASNEAEKRRIEDAARTVKGVMAVDNGIEIREPTTTTGAPSPK